MHLRMYGLRGGSNCCYFLAVHPRWDQRPRLSMPRLDINKLVLFPLGLGACTPPRHTSKPESSVLETAPMILTNGEAPPTLAAGQAALRGM